MLPPVEPIEGPEGGVEPPKLGGPLLFPGVDEVPPGLDDGGPLLEGGVI